MKEVDDILQVRNLRTYFRTDNGLVRAVDRISLGVRRGDTVGIVGESGCGKSVTALSIMNLVRPPGRIVAGQILYRSGDGSTTDIAKLHPNGRQMRSLRGNNIAMIFQEPMTALTPVYSIGDQIAEGVMLHKKLTRRQARERAIEILGKVGIPSPEKRIDDYPHQFSGGMRQRAMIAMALSCEPEVVIADEPTTALDVTIEAQILRLMKEMQSQLDLSIIMITHDLGVIAEMADRVNVMYTGKIVEHAQTDDIFYNPKHPYTLGLLQSIPTIGDKRRLTPIRGAVPNLLTLPEDVCYFAPRCPYAMEICAQAEPPMYQVGTAHQCKCWLYEGNEVVAV